MKTEKQFSESFIEAYNKADPQGRWLNEVRALAPHYWSDLTSHLSSYFSNEDRWAITEQVGLLLGRQSGTMTFDDAWKNVLRDFTHNQYWGFSQISKKPQVEKTEEQKIFWSLFKYTWAFFQSMVILKIAVYYFGLESASHPDQVNSMWVWFFFSLSAGSLGFFAYRNRNDKN